MQAVLALEDGRLFWGKAFGAGSIADGPAVERVGEVVFNTSLTGYQEIFTDPSYAGQIVVLTNPHIGNYGTSPSDAESARPYIEGLVVRAPERGRVEVYAVKVEGDEVLVQIEVAPQE